jgi:hypothetical protein
MVGQGDYSRRSIAHDWTSEIVQRGQWHWFADEYQLL